VASSEIPEILPQLVHQSFVEEAEYTVDLVEVDLVEMEAVDP
jgi:hypothetical protein